MPMEKTFTPADAEARISARWDAANAFAAGAAKRRDEAFCVMIPPPNVTGSLHMGHAFNNTLQDILVRWHRMRGFDTLWQVGTDHAGIATQMVTEREMAANGEPDRRTMGRDKFLARVWQQKVKSRGTIIGQLKRLGASCDWSREAFTMGGAAGDPEAGKGPNFHDAVIKVFVDMYNKGLIYRGKRLVNWDPHFETAISDLEVENSEVDGHMWHFKYLLQTDPATGKPFEFDYVERDEDGNVVFSEPRNYISIATTRPETMLGDGAVAVHPSDERYAAIVGKLCEIPVGPKQHRRLIPIITDEYPDPSFGSGAVKITGAHDFNDYAVAKRGGIPCYRLMDTRAQMRADGAPYAEVAAIAGAVARGERKLSEAEVDALNLVPDHLRGLDRFAARAAVVAEITAEGLAVMTRADDPRLGKAALKPDAEGAGAPAPLVEAKKIMQPFGDRSKVVIEPMLTDQWFVDAAKIVRPALDAVRDGRVRILPESGEKTYYHWLENIEPWCISRQLWWGHQIPVWYGPKKSELESLPKGKLFGTLKPYHPEYFCAPTEQDALLLAESYYGSGTEVHFSKDVDDPVSYEAGRFKDSDRSIVILHRDPDVLDTWFSSGLWPIGTLGWPEPTEEMRKYFPTSVLITGSDILFFWVARMMMMQLAVVDQVPFHDVYLHGLVRDAKGKKMSKSLGNVVDPLDIIDEFGADALRFSSAAMAALGGVLKLDTQRIAGYRNFGTKLWNACRFAEMNGVWEGHRTHDAPPTPQATVNRWILGETARAVAEVDAALADYRFNDAASALYGFVWGKVCDWYVEFAKPLLADPDSAPETRATMAWVLDQCMILLHPMMPFITEELWSITGARKGLICHQPWPELPEAMIDPEAERELRWVIALIEGIRSARAQMGVPVGLHLPVVMTGMDDRGRAAWGRNVALIKRLARLGDMTEGPAPKGSVTIPVEGGGFALPLAGVIDVAGESARLTKALAKLDKDIAGLQARLGNPKFIASAAEDVVIETRDLAEKAADEAGKLRAALARLAELG